MRSLRSSVGAALVTAMLAMLVAACGSDTDVASVQLVDSSAAGAGQSGNGGTPADAPPGPVAPASWVQLSAAGSDLGTVVTDVNGHTLYRFEEDTSPPRTHCSGRCATTWPPMTVQPGAQAYIQGIDRMSLGTVVRPDGSRQMTIASWPVYPFAGDNRSASTTTDPAAPARGRTS